MCGSLSPAPPLTVENIVKEVEGVGNISDLQLWLDGYVDVESTLSIKDIVENFLQGDGLYQPSWKAVILALDKAGETRIANRIRHYAEPVQGRYMLRD